MVRWIFFEESPNSKVAIRVGILAMSYLALRSLIYNFIYPTCIFAFYTILQLCGMLLEFLMAPFHVVGSNLMISPFGYVIKGLFLDISSKFPFNLVLFREKVPVQRISMFQFPWVLALKIFIATGICDELSKQVQFILRMMRSKGYLFILGFFEFAQVLTTAVLIGRVVYKWTYGALWASQKLGKFTHSPDHFDNLVDSAFSTTHIKWLISNSKNVDIGHGYVITQPMLSSWLEFLNVMSSINMLPILLSYGLDEAFSFTYRVAGFVLEKLNLRKPFCRYLRIGVKSYCLSNLDFLTRMGLVSSLAVHVRRARFYDGTELHKALLKVLQGEDWKDREAFKKCRPELEKFNHAFEFLKWFLEWNTLPESPALATQTSVDFTKTIEKVTTYDGACTVFKALDMLPYILYDFGKVFYWITTHGALSHPPIARALINHYAQYPDYFQFFKALDRRWWLISEQVDGHPAAREHRYCFQEHSKRSKTGRRPERAARFPPNTPDREYAEESNYSLAFAGPKFEPILAFWHVNAPVSLISPQLVEDLGLTPVATGRVLNYITAVGVHEIVEKTVRVDIRLSGIPEEFNLVLCVFENSGASITLGGDFWRMNDIIFQGGSGIFLAHSDHPVPTICPAVLSKCKKNGQKHKTNLNANIGKLYSVAEGFDGEDIY